jgi:hypothetical protein
VLCTVPNSLSEGLKKALLKAIFLIFDNEHLREFEAKIARALTILKEACAEPIYTKKIKKTFSLPCPFNTFS